MRDIDLAPGEEIILERRTSPLAMMYDPKMVAIFVLSFVICIIILVGTFFISGPFVFCCTVLIIPIIYVALAFSPSRDFVLTNKRIITKKWWTIPLKKLDHIEVKGRSIHFHVKKGTPRNKIAKRIPFWRAHYTKLFIAKTKGGETVYIWPYIRDVGYVAEWVDFAQKGKFDEMMKKERKGKK